MLPDPTSTLGRLMSAPVRPGEVVWLGLRPARRAPMIAVEAAEFVAGRGLTGDRYASRGGARQVTLIQAESLSSIASHLGLEAVAPETLRRNVVTRGVNLTALKGRQFRLGGARLECTGECHPCSRMEEAFGPGGYNAVRGLGGVTARILDSGPVRLGDALIVD